MKIGFRFYLILLFIVSVGYTAEYSEIIKKVYNANEIKELTLDNFNGSIHVSGEDRNVVEIIAYKYVRAKRERKAKKIMDRMDVEFNLKNDRLEITTDLPNRGSESLFSFISGSSSSMGIDFEIIVPKMITLDIETRNGKVTIKNVDGSIAGHSTNGKVNGINISGEIELSTKNGSIEAFLDKEKEIKSFSGESTNGRIVVNLDQELGFKLFAKTVNGRIYSDYPVEISGKYVGKKATGTVNGGGIDIRLKTVNGSINILTM